MEKLFEYSNKLIKEADTGFLRYMYNEINWQSRMIGLIGPRGVGKTTLVLQYIWKIQFRLPPCAKSKLTLEKTL